MARGIRSDLRSRFEKAHEDGRCLVPSSPSEAKRLSRALARGDICSPAHRVYALPELWKELNPKQKELCKLRALSTLHPTWVFAGVSAAVLHGLQVSYSLLGTTYVADDPAKPSRPHPGCERVLIANDAAAEAHGVPVTSLVRTTFDCLRWHDFRSALAIADSALQSLEMSGTELAKRFEEYHNAHWCKRRAVQTAMLADARAENGGESVARAAMLQLGFMLPQLQVEIPDPVNPSSTFRVDFCWDLPQGRVIGEMDGREKYRNPTMTHGRDVVDVLADERLRESRLSGTGARVMRFSYADVMDLGRFSHLLQSYGIPSGFEIPDVADLRDVVNFDLRGVVPVVQTLHIDDSKIRVAKVDLTDLREQGVIRKDGTLRREKKTV